MKSQSLLKLLAVGSVAAIASVTAHAGGVVYAHDTTAGQPWGVSSYLDAFNADFGANWSEQDIGLGAALFNPSNSFIMLEGGDGNTDAFDAFFANATNVAAMQSWVAAGGDLLINAGSWPDVNDNTVDTGLGAVISNPNYAEASNTGTAYTGPVLPGLSPLITTFDGNDSLVQEQYGSGFVVIGGLTTPNFQSSGGTALLDNLLLYTNSGGTTALFDANTGTSWTGTYFSHDIVIGANAPDGASTVALLGAAVLGLAALSRRRAATLS